MASNPFAGLIQVTPLMEIKQRVRPLAFFLRPWLAFFLRPGTLGVRAGGFREPWPGQRSLLEERHLFEALRVVRVVRVVPTRTEFLLAFRRHASIILALKGHPPEGMEYMRGDGVSHTNTWDNRPRDQESVLGSPSPPSPSPSEAMQASGTTPQQDELSSISSS